MLMISIRDYVKLKGQVDLQNIARHFCLPESAVAQMLNFWIKKGVIKLITLSEQYDCGSAKCRDCFNCHSDTKAIYEWPLTENLNRL